MECPVCSQIFSSINIENHVDTCLVNNPEKINTIQATVSNKRFFPFMDSDENEMKRKKSNDTDSKWNKNNINSLKGKTIINSNDHIPLAEKMRPVDLSDYVGQKHVIGGDTIIGKLLEKKQVTSMILWGPPGCGKTSLANIIAKMHNNEENTPISSKFIKISATSSGINDIRDAVSTALTEARYGRKTILFMNEIHRFNKLQQDIFLPHVEAGTFILIGTTTENPSFSLNSALLSRCRVISLEKLSPRDIVNILTKAIERLGGKILANCQIKGIKNHSFLIEEEAVTWLAEICDGDARIALNSLDLTIKSIRDRQIFQIRLDDMKVNLERAYTACKTKSQQNKNLVAALHTCIRAGHSNGALYWLARLMAHGEDPVYIGKRLIRIASEDVSEDPEAVATAVHTMHGCQMVGMPECDVLLAQCVCYLCKAKKSRIMNSALRCVQKVIAERTGPQPPVPTFMRDTSSQQKLPLTIGNRLSKIQDNSRNHLPECLEIKDFFSGEENYNI